MRFWLMALFCFSCFGHACVLKVQVNDFPPYSYQKDGEWLGSRVVLSQRLSRELNCTVRFLDIPWARALILLQQGEIDLMFNLTPTPERQRYAWFSQPHHTERLGFATTLTEPQWQLLKKADELRQFPGIIALTQGSYMGPVMTALLSEPAFRQKITEVAERRVKNELVLRGRAQGLVEDLDYLRFAVANFPEYQTLIITPLVLSESKVSAGFSRLSPLFSRINDIEAAISHLQQQGLWYSQQP